jgi:hypothetical protein
MHSLLPRTWIEICGRTQIDRTQNGQEILSAPKEREKEHSGSQQRPALVATIKNRVFVVANDLHIRWRHDDGPAGDGR